jgi:hypothetical protein
LSPTAAFAGLALPVIATGNVPATASGFCFWGTSEDLRMRSIAGYCSADRRESITSLDSVR